MSRILEWLAKRVRSFSSSTVITREIIRRGTVHIPYLRIATTGSVPTTIYINQHTVPLTQVAATDYFINLQNNSGTNLPVDSSGETLEGYYNSSLNQIIVFGIGQIFSPHAIYRYALRANDL